VGRRRYRKREEEASPFEEMLSMAFGSVVVGAFLAVLFLLIGLWLRSQPKAAAGLAPMLGGLMLLVAAVLGIAAVIGLLYRSGGAILEAIGGGLAAWMMPRRGPRATPPPPPVRPGPPRRKVKPRSTAPPVPMPPLRPAPPLPVPPLRPAMTTTAASMLTPGEMAFYDPLRDIVAGRFEIHVKPSLADVLQCRSGPLFEEAARMHVDFLLCDRQTLQPRLAIELDDGSHRDPRRAASDCRKDDLLHSGGIRVLRERCQTAYDVQLIRERIERAVG
jgi:hypothetical protein